MTPGPWPFYSRRKGNQRVLADERNMRRLVRCHRSSKSNASEALGNSPWRWYIEVGPWDDADSPGVGLARSTSPSEWELPSLLQVEGTLLPRVRAEGNELGSRTERTKVGPWPDWDLPSVPFPGALSQSGSKVWNSESVLPMGKAPPTTLYFFFVPAEYFDYLTIFKKTFNHFLGAALPQCKCSFLFYLSCCPQKC